MARKLAEMSIGTARVRIEVERRPPAGGDTEERHR
jgi:hypothetical protein